MLSPLRSPKVPQEAGKRFGHSQPAMKTGRPTQRPVPSGEMTVRAADPKNQPGGSDQRRAFRPLLEARHLRKTYGLSGNRFPALQGVDLEVRQGDFAAIMGPSGCGKTTLLNCLAGIDTVDEGTIRFNGREMSGLPDRTRTQIRGEQMGFVFQAFQLVPVLTAAQNVQLPLELRGIPRREAHARALEALTNLGIADQAGKLPSEMSGGQQQRVAIARAVANRPLVIFADEPTGNLDTKTTYEVLDLFQDLSRRLRLTLVVVTHDERVAKRANIVLRMDSGRVASVAEQAPTHAC